MTNTSSQERSRLLAIAAVLAAAATAWMGGSLPWILEGMQLPISSAWPGVAPEDDVRVALPFGEYRIVALVTAGVVGGAAAVGVARLLGTSTYLGALAGAAGLGVALAQALLRVWPLVADTGEARLLWIALIVAGIIGVVVGPVIGLALRRRTTSAAVSAGTLACLGHGWLIDMMTGDTAVTGPPPWLVQHSEWLLGACLAAALVATGWRTPGALLRWLLVLAACWAMTAVVATASYVAAYARSGMNSGGGLRELLDATRDVFGQSMQPTNRGAHFVVVGLVLALMMVACVGVGNRLAQRRVT